MQLVNESGLHLARGVGTWERSHRPLCECVRFGHGSTGSWEGAKRASLSLNVLGTIGLQLLRQPPLAPEARRALAPSSLPSTSQTGSKVTAFFWPVLLTLVLGSCFMRGLTKGGSAQWVSSPQELLIFCFGYRMDEKAGSILDTVLLTFLAVCCLREMQAISSGPTHIIHFIIWRLWKSRFNK